MPERTTPEKIAIAGGKVTGHVLAFVVKLIPPLRRRVEAWASKPQPRPEISREEATRMAEDAARKAIEKIFRDMGFK